VSISIALATYNAARNLGCQLQSIAEQTLKPGEIVICDDGSQDGTSDIVQEFMKRAPCPVRFMVNPDRLGWKRNFAQAALQCTGELIAFCDQDDFWMPGKLELLSREALSGDWDALAHRNAFLFESAIEIGRKPTQRLTEFSKSAVFYGGFDGHRLLFHRRLLPWLNLQKEFADWLIPGEMAHDRLIMFGALTGGRAGHLDTVLTLFRRHAGQVTTGAETASTGKDYAARADVISSWVTGIEQAEVAGLATRSQVSAMRCVLERLALSHRARAELYNEERFSGRIRKIVNLVTSRAYASRDAGALGARSFLKDANRVVIGR
jgi:glycosyltransferase involved in cell wall biosynthesis